MLNPRVDFAFKKLFGAEENKEILMSLINAVVSEADRVSDVTLMNPENNRGYDGERLSVLDIKAIDTHGHQYNIEMQITDQVYYNQRALYYWSKLYTSQLNAGDLFSDLKKTISINILNFDYFANEADYHNVFKLLNVKSHQSYFEDMELHFIELNKFGADLNHIKTALDRWITFLKKAHHYEKNSLPQELKRDPAIAKAFETLTHLSLDKAEREIYEARLKWLRDEAAAIEKAELESFKEGKQEGLQQGREEERKALASRLLAKGLSVQEVAEFSGLPLDVLAHLQK
jgi:predicted transposase/invertase (TIGR01784 family)